MKNLVRLKFHPLSLFPLMFLSACALFPPQAQNLPADSGCKVYRGTTCISKPGSQMPDRYCAVYNDMTCVQPVIDTPAMAR